MARHFTNKNQARQTRRRSYCSSPISRKRGTRSNVAKCAAKRTEQIEDDCKATLILFNGSQNMRTKINGNKAPVNAKRLHRVSLSACDDSVFYIYLFHFPVFCKTTQRLISLQHATHFIIYCHPNTRQYPRIISASGSKSFLYRDALEEWRPHARNT